MLSRLTRTGVSALVTTSLIAMPVVTANACTSVLLPAKDGGFVYGRTLEFGLQLESQIIVVPRGITVTGTGPEGAIGQGGLAWTTKYAATGTNALGLAMILDGVNERGLSGGLFNFPGYADFQKVPLGKGDRSIASFEILTWILTSFATVEEVKAALPTIYVSAVKVKTFNDMVPPIHVSVHDASGKSLVIEYTDGGTLHMYDNPAHVLTNAPDFPFHLKNLSQYQYVTANVLPPLKVGTVGLSAASSGDGMNGLPGGFLAPARFVRAFFAQANAPVPATSAEAVGLSFHIMNAFDLPPGSIGTSASAGGEGGGVSGYETTEWIAASDMKNLRYYVRTYENPTIQVIDLAKAAKDLKAIKYIPLDRKPTMKELTP
ncbi:MAG: choloylglycine hydrolase family protein [Rhodoplanes sp.]|uniref:choloylglycine hydrolase family protein n=1 Tax=Rhodoplanes sp. TaxID=1968906 RepID=UPI00179427F0|nr:choloylglycine hydrolase family protein [Rhodoplanes sp.]NVO16495.1 choloylglycine hydrolase family protein [Rhodoplanes sp.]